MSAQDYLYFIFSILAIAAILFGCYKLSKYMTKRVSNSSNTNNMKIIERIALTQDKGLLIVEICQKYYLIGFANNSIEILKELDEAEMHFEKASVGKSFLETLNAALKGGADSDSKNASIRTEGNPTFFEALHTVVRSKMDLKAGGKGDKIDSNDKTDKMD